MSSGRESGNDDFSLPQDQRIAQFIESAPMVGDGAVSDSDILALMQMGRGLVRLAALAGTGGSSVLQGIALVYDWSSTTPRVDKIASLFNLAAALGYGGSFALNELANWIDAQIQSYEGRIDAGAMPPR